MYVFRQARNSRLNNENGRFKLLFASDLHIGAAYGVYAGLSVWDRAWIMTQFLMKDYGSEEDTFDLFIGNGDMASNEENELKDRQSYFERLQRRYVGPMMSKGVPTYFTYANHDDLTDEEWQNVLGYPKDYIIDLDDDVSLVCLDMYHGPQSEESRYWGFGGYADMKPRIYEEASAHVKGKKHVLVVCHFADDGHTPLLARFMAENDNVRAAIVGHTHGTAVTLLGGKPCIQCGHFSWSGDTWGCASDQTAASHIGPWGFRCVEFDGKTMEAYMIYPEHSYGELSGYGNESGWITCPAFHQPRYATKSFDGGTHVPIPLK